MEQNSKLSGLERIGWKQWINRMADHWSSRAKSFKISDSKLFKYPYMKNQ